MGGDFRDPVTRVEYSDDDLRRLDECVVLRRKLAKQRQRMALRGSCRTSTSAVANGDSDDGCNGADEENATPALGSVLAARHNPQAFADLNFRRDALLSVERCTGELVVDMLNLVERLSEQHEAQLVQQQKQQQQQQQQQQQAASTSFAAAGATTGNAPVPYCTSSAEVSSSSSSSSSSLASGSTMAATTTTFVAASAPASHSL